MPDPNPPDRSRIDPGRMCLYHFLAARADETPDAMAITAPGHTPLSYGRLRAHLQDEVTTLNNLGLGRNDRVAIVLPNGPEMAVTFLAVATAATAAPINPAYRGDEFDSHLSALNAQALIVQAGIDSPARAIARRRAIPVIEVSPMTGAVFSLGARVRPTPNRGGIAGPDDVALVLPTSGTTSQPKLVPLTHRNICVSALNIAGTLHLTPGDRCLQVMPLFHIHGLIGALLSSLVAGAGVVCTSNFQASRFFEWIAEFCPTWYTAVPTIHHAIVAAAPSHRALLSASPLRFIRSCSSALPPRLQQELEATFNVPVIESYGMTEAAHQITSNPLPPRERKPSSVGLAAGPEVAIMDDVGRGLAPGQVGEIVIRGANVTPGYDNLPQRNDAPFIDGWWRTGDQGFLDPEGYLFITGRLKEIINRGGQKLSPREVDEVLLDHPAVAQAVSFPVPHPTLGEDLAAAVVLRDKARATDKQIRDFVATQLADFKVPRRVLILDTLPEGATGKLKRAGLAHTLGLVRQSDAASCVPARGPVEYHLTKIWEELLTIRPIGIRDNFFDLGGDSLLAVQMMEQVEHTFGAKLSPAALFSAATIEHLAKALLEHHPEDLYSPLVKVQSGGSRRPFFFVHGDYYNGGLYCLRLARYLGEDQPFYALAPDWPGDQQFPGTVEAMAASHLEALRAVQPQGPYLLGGFCNGGVIAFEMARQLQAHGESVDLLVVIAASAWNTTFRSLHRLISRAGKLLGLTAEARLALFRKVRDSLIGVRQRTRHIQHVLRLAPREQVAFVLQMLKRPYWRLAEHLRPRERRREAGQDVADAYFRVIWSYVPQPYPGRLHLFWPREEPPRPPNDPTMGWGEVAREVQVDLLPGDHLACISTHAEVLADRLKAYLREAQMNGGRPRG